MCPQFATTLPEKAETERPARGRRLCHGPPVVCVFRKVHFAQQCHVRLANVNTFSDTHFIKRDHPWKVLIRLASCLNNVAEYDTLTPIGTASYLDALFLELLLAFPSGP